MKKGFKIGALSIKSWMPNFRLLILICLCFAKLSVNAKVNMVKNGADNKGVVICTSIINSTIDSLFSVGGGELFFPVGLYLTGPIELKSNITINLEAGAVLKFTDNFDDYLPMVDSRWEGVRVKNFKSPIYAHNATNITIKGRGMIDGSGEKWWNFWWPLHRGEISKNSKWEQLFYNNNKELIEKNAYLRKMGNFLRPPLFMSYECNNVRVEGVSFKNPPFWTIMPAFSENVTIDGITIINPKDSPNTDGIDPSSCKNVRISNCHISVGDDCIVIKSGRDEDGREANMPTENITITNCTMLDGHGGVVIGSEMSGSVRRVTISNCVFEGTDRGIRIKTMRGRGGVVEDIRVSNIIMYDIKKQAVMINMHYHDTPDEHVSERTPAIRNVFISNVRINNAEQAVAIYGLTERDAANITFNDVFASTNNGVVGNHASGVSFSNFQIESENKEPFRFTNSSNLEFRNVKILNPKFSNYAFSFQDCDNVLIKDCFQAQPIENYVYAEKCNPVIILNNILTSVENVIVPIDTKFVVKDNY